MESFKHHVVYHAKKPKNIKVVFECSAVFVSVSFIIKYYERFAVQGDIELMFYQVVVLKKDSDCLRSLLLGWKPGC